MQQHKTKMLLIGLAVSAAFLGFFVYKLFQLDGRLNVNSATAGQLRVLPGVDEPRAEEIVRKRAALGRFKSLDQFRAAAGLDRETFEGLVEYLAVLNVNEATLEQLSQLPGLGVEPAQRVVARRVELGELQTLKQVRAAAGLGKKAFKPIAREITLGQDPPLGRVIHEMGPTFRKAKWSWLWLAALIHLFSFVLRTWRWQVLLKPVKRVGFWSSFNPVMIGFMCNTLLPARAGEVARPAAFAAREGVSFSAALATVVLERVFDLLAVVVALGIAVTFLEEPPRPRHVDRPAALAAAEAPAPPGRARPAEPPSRLQRVKRHGRLVGPVALVLVVAFFAMAARPQAAERIMKKLTSFCPHAIQGKLIDFFDKFVVGLQALESKRDVIWLVFWTAAVWLDIVLVYYVTAMAFDIRLTLIGATLCFVFAAAAVAAPQAPGFIGSFQVACLLALRVLGVDPGAAASYAIMIWVVSMLPTVLLGLVCMALGGVSFKDVQAGEDA